jgi:hypothetical protein
VILNQLSWKDNPVLRTMLWESLVLPKSAINIIIHTPVNPITTFDEVRGSDVNKSINEV